MQLPQPESESRDLNVNRMKLECLFRKVDLLQILDHKSLVLHSRTCLTDPCLEAQHLASHTGLPLAGWPWLCPRGAASFHVTRV